MTLRVRVVFCCVAGLLGITPPVAAQSDWTLVPPTGTVPSPRAGCASSFDLTRGVWVLFGGQVGGGVSPQETWEFDGSAWTNVTSLPAPRVGQMAYDPSRQRHVLCAKSPSTPPKPLETWEWYGGQWQNAMPAIAPPDQGSVIGFALAYDPVNAGVLLYAGRDRETWLWNGSTWSRLSPRTTPPQVDYHLMVTDWRRARVVMYTGTLYRYGTGPVTWVWDGVDWSGVASANEPSDRGGAGMAYDWLRDRVVLFGGYLLRQIALGNETWEFDGTQWEQLVTGNSPTARQGMAMTYDPIGHRVLGFGGKGLDRQSGLYFLDNELWKLETSSPAAYGPLGPGCPGTAGVPTLSAPFGSLPWIDDGFDVDLRNAPTGALAFMATGFSASSWGGVPLPLDLGPFGAPGCLLRLAPFVWGPFAPGPSGVSRWTLPIPNNARLAGLTFFNQALVLDPGANALGAVVSDAMQGRVGIR